MPNDDKKVTPRRNLNRLFRMMGVKFPQDVPKLEKKEGLQLNAYSEAELRHLPGFAAKDEINKNIHVPELSMYLKQIAQGNSDWSEQSDAIKILTPEIDRSASIMVASIMSPTDIQTDTVNVVCRDSDLGEEIESKISELLTKFFNSDTFDIGGRTYKYIKEALYESGSSAILVLPQKNIEILNKAADLDLLKSGRAILRSKKNKFENTNKSIVSGESLIPQISTEELDTKISTELLESLERKNPFVSFSPKEVVTKSKDARKQILELFNSTKESVILSQDVSMLRNEYDRVESVTEKMTKEIEKNFLFDSQNPTYLVDTAYEHDKKSVPSVLEIPSRAVVPVIIPGSPDKHIGYFILVDQWGIPLTSNAMDRQSVYGPRKLTEAATQAVFGSPSLYRFSSSITDEQRFDITSTIFGITLKQLMGAKLEDYGLVGTTIEESDAISSCLFRQILAKKKSTLVFVPEQLMTYLRFDHRNDGTGKSITESLSTILSLRTVLIISYVMAATENSINNKTITVAVDEKQTNVQQYLEMIRNAYISKKMMRFDVNPLTVQQDLIQKSLTILPKGIKGLSDSLDVQTEHRQTGAVTPDEGLLEKIDNLVVTALEVPHSALNQLSENEYSRSVATTNMYFSNNVKTKQKVVIKHISKLVKLYTKYSFYLRDEISKIIKASETTVEDNEESESSESSKTVPKSDIKVKTNDDSSLAKKVETAINCIKITLPTPRIVVDKSQYTEIEQYIGTVEKICESVYPDDLLAGDAQALQDTLRILRASIREKMIRDYIEKIGFNSAYDLPHTNDIDFDSSMNLIKLLSNKRKGISDWMKQIVEKSSSDDQMNNTGDTSGGMGGDMSGMNDMNMGGGEGGANDFDNMQEPPALDENQSAGTQPAATSQTQRSNEPGADFDNVEEPPAF